MSQPIVAFNVKRSRTDNVTSAEICDGTTHRTVDFVTYQFAVATRPCDNGACKDPEDFDFSIITADQELIYGIIDVLPSGQAICWDAEYDCSYLYVNQQPRIARSLYARGTLLRDGEYLILPPGRFVILARDNRMIVDDGPNLVIWSNGKLFYFNLANNPKKYTRKLNRALAEHGINPNQPPVELASQRPELREEIDEVNRLITRLKEQKQTAKVVQALAQAEALKVCLIGLPLAQLEHLRSHHADQVADQVVEDIRRIADRLNDHLQANELAAAEVAAINSAHKVPMT